MNCTTGAILKELITDNQKAKKSSKSIIDIGLKGAAQIRDEISSCGRYAYSRGIYKVLVFNIEYWAPLLTKIEITCCLSVNISIYHNNPILKFDLSGFACLCRW